MAIRISGVSRSERDNSSQNTHHWQCVCKSWSNRNDSRKQYRGVVTCIVVTSVLWEAILNPLLFVISWWKPSLCPVVEPIVLLTGNPVFSNNLFDYCVIRTRKRQAFADSETNNLSRVFRQTDNSCNRNSALFNKVAKFSLAIHISTVNKLKSNVSACSIK